MSELPETTRELRKELFEEAQINTIENKEMILASGLTIKEYIDKASAMYKTDALEVIKNVRRMDDLNQALKNNYGIDKHNSEMGKNKC